jgi:hypothetical protein
VLCAGAGLPEPELRHILPEPELEPELENSGKNSGRQNYEKLFQRTFGNGKIKLNDLKLL